MAQSAIQSVAFTPCPIDLIIPSSQCLPAEIVSGKQAEQRYPQRKKL
jgi:hypothetical protein